MIRNGFLRDVYGRWINLSVIHEIDVSGNGIIASFKDPDYEEAIILDNPGTLPSQTLKSKQEWLEKTQEWLDKMMCGEI
jgi:hypothetical protein